MAAKKSSPNIQIGVSPAAIRAARAAITAILKVKATPEEHIAGIRSLTTMIEMPQSVVISNNYFAQGEE